MKVEVKETIKREERFIAEDGTVFSNEEYCLVYEKFGCNVENIFKEYFYWNSNKSKPWKIKGTFCFVKKEVPNEVIACLRSVDCLVFFGGITTPEPNVIYRVVEECSLERINKAQKIGWVKKLQKEIAEIEEFEKEMNR